MLLIDLGVFNRKAHVISTKEALIWTAVWVAISFIFNGWIYFTHGEKTALEFLTGYILEKSLSVDNIFVFILLFSYFNVSKRYQHKILFWGIIGAIILRGILIILGAALIVKFKWIIYIFGAFLVFTGIKMAIPKKEEIDPMKNPLVKLIRKIFPVTPFYVRGKFFVKSKHNKLYATPLIIVLAVVESTDLVFAFDSIPAILAITHDPFIVFTSNAFAILGLRALYFALANVMDKFRFLKYGLSVILVFIGIKMLITYIFHIPVFISLIVIMLVLIISVLASILIKDKAQRAAKI
jgi:tellurite resistance protein TerC